LPSALTISTFPSQQTKKLSCGTFQITSSTSPSKTQRTPSTQQSLSVNLQKKKKTSLLAAGYTNGDIELFDLVEGKSVLNMPKAHSSAVVALSFTSQNKLLLSASANGTVSKWDLKEQKAVSTIQASKKQKTASLRITSTHDSSSYAVAINNVIKVYHSKNDELYKTVESHVSNIQALEFSTDNKYIISASQDSNIIVVSKLNEEEKAPVLLQAGNNINSVQMHQIKEGVYITIATSNEQCYLYLVIENKKKKISKPREPSGVIDSGKDKNIVLCSFTSQNNVLAIQGKSRNFVYSHVSILGADGKIIKSAVIEQAKVVNGKTEATNGFNENADMIDVNESAKVTLSSGIIKSKLKDLEKHIIAEPPKAKKEGESGSVKTVLQQALHINDLQTLSWILSQENETVIEGTVKSLDNEVSLSFLKFLVTRLQGKAKNTRSITSYLTHLLRYKASAFLRLPEAKEIMQQMDHVIGEKTQSLEKLISLQAKIDLTLTMSSQEVTHSKEKKSKKKASIPDNSKPAIAYDEKEEDKEEIDEVVEKITKSSQLKKAEEEEVLSEFNASISGDEAPQKMVDEDEDEDEDYDELDDADMEEENVMGDFGEDDDDVDEVEL